MQAAVRTYSNGGCDALSHYLEDGYVVVYHTPMYNDDKCIIEYIVEKEIEE